MADRWGRQVPGVSGPFRASAAIDLSEADADLSEDPPRAIYATGAGNIVVRLLDDSADTTFAVAAASVNNLRVSAIRKTDTTATGLKALY